MESFGKVNISINDFEKIKSRKIGEGRDSVVYNAGKGMLFKVYKDESNLKDLRAPMKIYEKGSKKLEKNPSRICYLDKEGVIIYYRDAFKRILKRQSDIKLSSLPKGSLYINGKFSGCVLDKINGLQLHYVFPFLSMKNKIKVLKEILLAVKELTDNYIYPLDTNNSPFAGKHSNILIGLNLKPKLIDLDGNSTVYRENYDENMHQETLFALNMLFMELLNGIVYGDELADIDLEMIKDKLVDSGVNESLAYKLSEYNANYSELNELLNTYKR